MITEQEVDRLLDTVWDDVIVHDEPTELRLTTDPLPQSETAFRSAIIAAACFIFFAFVLVGSW